MNTHRPHRTHVFSVALLLAAGLWLRAWSVSAQTVRTVTVRQAERAIRAVQDELHTLYAHSGALDPPWPNANCFGTTERDCFYADRECPECYWEGDGPFLKMMEHYERTLALVRRAPAGGVRADRLNWLAGHHIGTWVRLGELERAAAAAADCHAALWWCDALRGFVAHRQGNFAHAEQLFRRSLRLAPVHIRCIWNDILPITDSLVSSRQLAGKPGLLGPVGPCRLLEENEDFWILADPLFATPGNERMTEHYARQVDLQISRDFLFMMRSAGLDNAFVRRYVSLIAHGRPTSYVWRSASSLQLRDFQPSAPGERRSAVDRQGPAWKASSAPRGTARLEHGPPGAQSFTQALSVAEALNATQPRFEPGEERRRESYLPPYGRVLSFPLQTGFFRVDGAPVLLVRSSVPAREPDPDRDWQLHGWDGSSWRRGVVQRSGDTLVARLPAPWVPQLISLEAIADSGAYRARTGNRPPENGAATALSSLVVTDGATEPRNLDEAARAMLPTQTVTPVQRTGGYWELYTTRTRTARIELAVRRADPGVLARWLGIGRRPDRVVRWTEELQPRAGVVARAIGLDLAALEPGEYDIALTLTLDDGSVLRSVARVIIADASAPGAP